MRVISGTARGLRIAAPRGTDVRPTTDRVREATFNALGSLGVIEAARVLDLFAGSGALGIEALSRGAAHCTFVDSSRASIAAVEENLERTALAGRASVVGGEAGDFVAQASAGDFDLLLADPPYGFDAWAELLGPSVASVAVLESDREPRIPAGWSLMRQRRYGTTVVAIVRRHEDSL